MSTWRRDPLNRAVTLWLVPMVLLASAFVAAALLFAAYSAFTNFRYGICDYDYTNYTQMIWNSGRGALFQGLKDSYLRTHLSFSLALLGPLFRVWDHPFLLAIVQWLFLAGGCACLVYTARRKGLRGLLPAAVVFLLWAHHYSQNVQLSSFHGVSAYYLLIPWLYATLCFRRGFVWLPFLLILGLREDSGLMVAPLLLYVAARQRWKTGYDAAVAVAYCALAVLVLYPLINDVSLVERRFASAGLGGIERFLDADAWARRGSAVLWTFLPVLPLLLTAWGRMLAILSLPLLITLLGGKPVQYGFRLHYPAVVMACLFVSVLESAGPVPRRLQAPTWRRFVAVWMIVTTLCSYYLVGSLPPCARDVGHYYRRTNPLGREAIGIARAIPQRGVLLVPRYLSAFAANRGAMLIRDSVLTGHEVDYVFCARRELPEKWRESVRAGRARELAQTEHFVVLEAMVPLRR